VNWEQETNKIAGWMKEIVAGAGAKGVVVGLSGGIDSSVVAAISKKAFPENVAGVIMPCYSNLIDTEHGQLVAATFDIPIYTVDLAETFTSLHQSILRVTQNEANRLTVANMKPRLRMTALYYFAGLFNYLVAGTGNKSELEIGYFTKYGDGGVDMEPIGHLLKTEVRMLAEYLGVPREIILKEPSAGLWEAQTDEEEMGITYAELDQYLLKGEGAEKVKSRVKELRRISEHKRHIPPVPSWKVATKKDSREER
jgi:NAD+ synthase